MKVIFLGGDLRQQYASDYLNKSGIYSEAYIDFCLENDIINKLSEFDVTVLPLPSTIDGIMLNMQSKQISIYDIIKFIPNDKIIIGGKLRIQTNNHKLIDYYQEESFQIYNALLSAEGAIYYAMNKITGTIYGSKTAVLGFGRIGKTLSYLLKTLGAKITIFARKESDLSWAKLIGFDTVKINERASDGIKRNSFDFDLIFNTIPSNVLREDIAKKLSIKTTIIDLASAPYGIDESVVNKYNLNYHRELGIPGRYAPKAAGEILGKTLLDILEKEGLL